jgi:ABC-2 type transport system ATP-binding protein
MTVREYLRFAGRLRGVSTKDIGKRVSEVLGMTELNAVADSVISNLSHGFRQRVGIAQTLVHHPPLVVLDEPISGLDPVQIVEMRRLIRNLRGEHTVLISSHILSEISETCDQILVIRDGQIAASGTEAELSAQLHGGMSIDLTVRLRANLDEAGVCEPLRGLKHVERVEVLPPREPGEQILSLRLTMVEDERKAVVSSLLATGCDLLELTRAQRELESVFLQLSEASALPRSTPPTNSTPSLEATS